MTTPSEEQIKQLIARYYAMIQEPGGGGARGAEQDPHLAPIFKLLRADPQGTLPPGAWGGMSEQQQREAHARLVRHMNERAIASIGDVTWEVLIRTIHKRECVPFLGAGASLGFDGAAGLPTAGTIARRLADFINYPGVDKEDFLRVCQYYELMAGKAMLRGEIADQLRVEGVMPGVVHTAIASMPFSCVLTTNYDDLMERAFRAVGKAATLGVYDMTANFQDLDDPAEDRPLVYKLHGSIERETTMVCTEDDVVQFLSCLINQSPQLPSPVRKVFQQKSFLFIGYGLRDWNIRVMLRAMRRYQQQWGQQEPAQPRHAAVPQPGQVWTKSFALQLRPHGSPDLEAEWKASVLYWDKLENVHCFDMDAAAFMQELARRYHARYPSARPQAANV
jgi:hypothetical protein